MTIHPLRALSAHSLGAMLCLTLALSARAEDAPKPERCVSVLAAKQLAEIVGKGFEFHDEKVRAPGQLECGWMRRGQGPIQILFVEHSAPDVLAANGNEFDPAKTAAELWEGNVASIEFALDAKREMLPELGAHAAWVRYQDTQIKVFWLQEKGLFSVTATNIDAKKLVPLLKALQAP